MSLLETRALTASYGDFQALYGIDTHLEAGETLAIIGANGAGKSTYLRAITGLVARKANSIFFDGWPIDGLSAAVIMRRGIAMVPEGRKLFPSLSVSENLKIGAYGRKAKGHWRLETVHELFPILAERAATPSQALSGGEQQMAAIGRAMMAEPRLLLIDEVSLGLMPKNVDICYEALERLRDAGITIILVEQSLERVLSMVDRVCVLETGSIAWTGTATEARGNPDVIRAYMGGLHV
jgi:branched-chain amino acid transport system ATP-binding protein